MKPARASVTRLVALLAMIAAFSGIMSRAQTADDVKAAYTKYEYQIPMRDGARLFTAVYVPKDISQKYPILLNRTPYSVAPGLSAPAFATATRSPKR